MDKIGNLTNILFVGGSAGDDLKFEATYVFANGTVYTDAAVLALLKPRVGFEVIKTQSSGKSICSDGNEVSIIGFGVSDDGATIVGGDVGRTGVKVGIGFGDDVGKAVWIIVGLS